MNLKFIKHTKSSTPALFTALLALDITPFRLDAAPKIDASGTNKTSSGVVHSCVGSSVTLSISGMDTKAPSSGWTYDKTTYSWSGNASGSSETATLDTGSEGDKSASCKLTHNYKCSYNSSTTTKTESASSSTIGIVQNDTNACTIPTPTAANPLSIQSGNKSVNNQLTETYFQGPAYVEEYYTGTYSNCVGNESFTAIGSAQPRPCGKELNESKTDVQHSIGLGYGIFSWSVTFPSRNATASEAAVSFKRIYFQFFDYNVTPTSADFSGNANVIATFNGNQTSNTKNVTGSKTLKGGKQSAGYDWNLCKVACCPSN